MQCGLLVHKGPMLYIDKDSCDKENNRRGYNINFYCELANT